MASLSGGAEWTAPERGLLEGILAAVSAAAREAGANMAANIGSVVLSTKSTSQDLVTRVDTECQEIVARAMRAAYPTHDMLGEEDVGSGAAASTAALEGKLAREWLWCVRACAPPPRRCARRGERRRAACAAPPRRIVDPIDGTTNFVHAIPASVVSIAVAHRGVVVVGVIFDPYRSELFAALRGGGAWLNGEAIRVSPEPEIRCVVVRGPPPRRIRGRRRRHRCC